MTEKKKKIEWNVWNLMVVIGLALYLVVRIVAYFVPNAHALSDLFAEADNKGRLVNVIYIVTFFFCPLFSIVCVLLAKNENAKKLMSVFYFVSGLSALTAVLSIFADWAYLIKDPSSWGTAKGFITLWFASATTAAVFILLCLLMFYQVLFQIKKPVYAIVLIALSGILVVTAVINLVIYAQGALVDNVINCSLVLTMRIGLLASNVGLLGALVKSNYI